MFVKYAIACHEENLKGLSYRIYITDTLQVIADNTARFNGGLIIKQRYIDLINKKPETRKARDIIEDLKEKLRKLGD